MEFNYAILDNGKPAHSKGGEPLYFFGAVRNSDRTCSIVTSDYRPVEDSPYSCTMSWDWGPGPETYVHYITITKNT
jgi:hypothetical protein